MRSVLSLTLFMKTLKSANAVFLELLILLVIPNVQSMELRHLRYFAAVVTHGSFSRAAKQLHLTQPALSRQRRCLAWALTSTRNMFRDSRPFSSHLGLSHNYAITLQKTSPRCSSPSRHRQAWLS